MSPAPASGYFASVNVLRALAALSVVVYHLIVLLPWDGFPRAPSLFAWFRVGWMGVDLFFVISGFVIALAAIRLWRAAEQPFAATYLRHRAARILPLYFLTGIVFLFTSGGLWHAPDLAFQLLSHVVFAHNWFPSTHGSINGVNWSIGTEVQFYLLVMLAIRWLARANPWLILAVTVAIAWFWRAGVFVLLGGSGADTWPMFVYSTQVFGMLDLFGLGIFLSRWVLDGPPWPGQDQPRQAVWIAASALAVIFLLTSATHWPGAAYWADWRMVVFWRTLEGLAFLALVGAMVFVRPSSGAFDRFVLGPMRYLGEISYGLYLWQLLVIQAVRALAISDPILNSALVLLALSVCAALSWHFIEKPILDRGRR